jgi:hypothetical protein
MKQWILSIVLLTSLHQGFAQSTIDTTEVQDARLDSLELLAQKRPYVEINGNYVSQVVYNGRTEGVTQYGLSPTITVHLVKGWSLSYSGELWSAAQPQYAFSSVGVNKDFEIGQSGSGAIGYSRWFSHVTDVAQKSDYTGSIDGDIHWEVGDFRLGSAASVLLGSSRALFIEPSIGYETSGRFGKDRLFKWLINPSATVDYGNDVPTRLVKKASRRPVKSNGKTAFGLLNYDVAGLATLSYKRTAVSFTYHLNIPKNTIAPNPISSFSYFEVALNQWFGL